MKLNVFLSLCLLIPMLSSANTSTQTLKLTLAKFKNISGVVHFKLLNCNDLLITEWDKLPIVHIGQFNVSDDTQDITFTDIANGQYCFTFFQDLNNNNTLDLAANSIPKEPVGFSNNPNLFKGKPSPSDSLFVLNKPTSLTIKVNNKKRR
ncbi:DUF2141 domain-containing protein [Pseudoalteromonas sp. MMG010]|uniref:DUF2141 domain-containing protein n=1 Tax=Pseudoalteromonas sp. MMG010 TaxID=2822685 RepID=UPI001B39EEEA|nr:DUF2141 domain-containing protein [Pseudoalteromonas sp. MMG010]MBQ4833492.1 DUF2141 domain-containing protein [Pseudoalteromonas sp. MMG010]